MPLTYILSLSTTSIIIISIVSSIIGLHNPIFLLNENQIFYLYSTSEQVLAGIYGLTLTGFIFFRNELSREEFEDDTLTEAVENLKSRYFNLLMLVTILSILTILASNFVISIEGYGNPLINGIAMNVAQVLFVIDLALIAYFIFDVISPKRIEKVSKIIQQRVDPSPTYDSKGSLEDFLKNYNTLEQLLQKYGHAYQADFGDGSGRGRRRISNVRLAEFILRAEKIDTVLFEKIKDLISLRNSIIHGAEPVVSENIVKESSNILTELSNALSVGI